LNSATAAEAKFCSTEAKPTRREFDVLELIWQGHSTKEIAAVLNISFKTAVTHRTKLMAKAEVHNNMHLVRWGLEHGYLAMPVHLVLLGENGAQSPGLANGSERDETYSHTLDFEAGLSTL
jgi:DNA-binding CsgD family transcriptional regulator